MMGAIFVIVGVGYWIYFMAGLKEYLQAELTISHLGGEQKEIIRQQFWVDDGEVFSGILGWISADRQWLWIWTNRQLSRYEVNGATIFTFYDICRAMENVGSTDQERGKFVVDDSVRKVTQDIEDWEANVAKGNYVQARVDPASSGKELIEVHAYRWPLFLPFEINKLCAE